MTGENFPFFCIFCDFLSESQAALTTHRLIHIANPEKIKQHTEMLNKNARKELNRIKHKNKIEVNGTENCAEKLDEKHNAKSILTMKCDLCAKEYKTKISLTSHIKSMHLGIVHICDLCGKELISKASLRAHTEIVHKGKESQNIKYVMDPKNKGLEFYNCKYCEYSTRRKHSLNMHVQIRHAGIGFKCTYVLNICQNIF